MSEWIKQSNGSSYQTGKAESKAKKLRAPLPYA
jgi:hypothetical protein